MVLSARTKSDNHRPGGVRERERGQRESREEDKVARRVSMAELGGMSEGKSGEGRADRTGEGREEGDRERRLQQIGTVYVKERGLRV